MPKQIKMYYARINNMGDALNGIILDKVFHVSEGVNPHINNFDVMGIGSCLDALIYGEGIPCKGRLYVEKDKILSALNPAKGYIWGTGFLREYPFDTAHLKRNKTEFVMVRGELTRQGVSKILDKEMDIPMGDGGLLASYLVSEEKVKNKLYDIGIIPHFREKDHRSIEAVRAAFPDKEVIVIDLQNDPIKVLEQIAACRYVISSSLHGLVCADSFNIPNTRIKLTDAPLGTGFKFDDYYSAFGLKKPALLIDADKEYSANELIVDVQVDPEEVAKKQTELITAMKYILERV